jgi:hypothetical protein
MRLFRALAGSWFQSQRLDKGRFNGKNTGFGACMPLAFAQAAPECGKIAQVAGVPAVGLSKRLGSIPAGAAKSVLKPSETLT